MRQEREVRGNKCARYSRGPAIDSGWHKVQDAEAKYLGRLLGSQRPDSRPPRMTSPIICEREDDIPLASSSGGEDGPASPVQITEPPDDAPASWRGWFCFSNRAPFSTAACDVPFLFYPIYRWLLDDSIAYPVRVAVADVGDRHYSAARS